MDNLELLKVLEVVDYQSLFLQGSTIGLILGGTIGFLSYGINICLKLFKIIK